MTSDVGLQSYVRCFKISKQVDSLCDVEDVDLTETYEIWLQKSEAGETLIIYSKIKYLNTKITISI